MNRVLVPVLTSEDLPHLHALASALAFLKPDRVVIMNSPSVGLSSETLTAEIDKQIAEVEKAKADATQREDFDAAKGWKARIEELKMQRGDVLRTSWKQIPEVQRFAAYDKFIEILKEKLQPLGTNIDHVPLTEDSSHDEFPGVLANLARNWIPGMNFGTFSIVPPQSAPVKGIQQSPQAVSVAPKVESAPKPSTGPEKATVKAPGPTTKEEKRAHYLRFFMSFKQAAKQHGVEILGKDKNTAIEEILAKEFPAAA